MTGKEVEIYVGERALARRTVAIPWEGEYRPATLVPTAIPSHHDVEHEVGRPCRCAERAYPCTCVEHFAEFGIRWRPIDGVSPVCTRHGDSFGAAVGRLSWSATRMFEELGRTLLDAAQFAADAVSRFVVIVDEAGGLPKVRERKKDRLAREARELQAKKAARDAFRAAQRGGQR